LKTTITRKSRFSFTIRKILMGVLALEFFLPSSMTNSMNTETKSTPLMTMSMMKKVVKYFTAIAFKSVIKMPSL